MPLSLPPLPWNNDSSSAGSGMEALLTTTVKATFYVFQNASSSTSNYGAVFSSTANTPRIAPVPSFVPIDHPFIVFAREIYFWLVPTMVSILTISMIGNGLIVLSAPWLGRHINPYNRLCISLAAADAWAASLLIAGLMVNSYMPVVLRIQKKSECVAAVLEIFRISGMLTSNLHILALAINQFIGIVYPLKYKMIVTTKRVRVLILLLWLIPVAFVGSWFVSIPQDGFRHPRCTHRFYSRFPFRLSVFTSFVIPLLSTFALYALILITLLKAKAKYSSHLRRSTRSSYRRRVKSKLKLVWTTLLILSTFTLSWGVCVLYFLLVCIEGCAFIYLKSVSFHAGFLMNSTVNFLVTLKLLLNPLIYALRMQHIRDSVFELLNAMCFQCFRQRLLLPHRTSLPHNQTVETELVSRRCSAQNSAAVVSEFASGNNNHHNNNNNNNNHLPMEQRPLTGSHSSSLNQPKRSRENGHGAGPNCFSTNNNRLRSNLARLSAPLELFRRSGSKGSPRLGDKKAATTSSESSEHPSTDDAESV